MSPATRRFLLSATILLIAAGVAATWLHFPMNEGDASIYLVFAKSMQNGFFHYGDFGPKGGATGPLWALLLSPFYAFGDPNVALLKLFSLLVLVGATFAFVAVSRAIASGPLPGLFGMLLFVSTVEVQEGTATLYELPLAVLMIGLALLFTVRLAQALRARSADGGPGARLWLFWGVSNGLLALTRPECVLVAAVSICYVGWRVLAVDRRRPLLAFLLSAALAVALTAWWNVFLYVYSGSFLPSSVVAREIRAEHLASAGLLQSSVNAVKVFIATPLSRLSPIMGVAFLAAALWPRRRGDAPTKSGYLFLCALPFLVLFAIKSPAHHLVRYMLPMKSIVFLLMGFGILRLVGLAMRLLEGRRAMTRLAAGLVALVCLAYAARGLQNAVSSMENRSYDIDVVLEREVAESLNAVARDGERVLVYEIQTQFYLAPEAISMDGIVGGEIIPYLAGGGTMRSFLVAERPEFVVVNHALDYRAELKGTILGELFRREDEVTLAGRITIEGIVFEKVFERSWDEVPFIGAAKSAYRVHYDRG